MNANKKMPMLNAFGFMASILLLYNKNSKKHCFIGFAIHSISLIILNTTTV